ncbi:hypothetical protein BC828DRAFT_392089 [Blastocladiella britannica]|nr:hypothetical protein BC828DRAFT_392089 [Blastocladiella britannica]
MGASPRVPYPRWVYSPTGGWWSQPKNWKSNTLVAAGGLALVTGLIMRWANNNQRQLHEHYGHRKIAVASSPSSSPESPAKHH